MKRSGSRGGSGSGTVGGLVVAGVRRLGGAAVEVVALLVVFSVALPRETAPTSATHYGRQQQQIVDFDSANRVSSTKFDLVDILIAASPPADASSSSPSPPHQHQGRPQQPQQLSSSLPTASSYSSSSPVWTWWNSASLAKRQHQQRPSTNLEPETVLLVDAVETRNLVGRYDNGGMSTGNWTAHDRLTGNLKTKRQLHRRHQQPQQHSLHHHHHQPRYASDDSASAPSPAARPDVVVDWSVSQPVCPSRSEWTLLRAARDIYDIEVEIFQPVVSGGGGVGGDARGSPGRDPQPLGVGLQWFYTVSCLDEGTRGRRDCHGCCIGIDHSRYLSSCRQAKTLMLALVRRPFERRFRFDWIQVNSGCSCAVVNRSSATVVNHHEHERY